MTAHELQQHYLGVLRAGAARMLQAAIDAYPDGLTKNQIADASSVSASGGTFSTYLGQLGRNGLVEQRDDSYAAADGQPSVIARLRSASNESTKAQVATPIVMTRPNVCANAKRRIVSPRATECVDPTTNVGGSPMRSRRAA